MRFVFHNNPYYISIKAVAKALRIYKKRGKPVNMAVEKTNHTGDPLYENDSTNHRRSARAF
jgi:hypothetical protein